MSTYTDTFNRDDIRRVYASFAADYKIAAEWTELHSAAFIEQMIVYFTQKWRDLTPSARAAFEAVHMIGWGTSDFDGNYGGLIAATDKRFASRAYGMERTTYRS